jgi:hypothetical protein
MNKKWDSCEKNLQRLENIVNFNSLGKRLIFLNQTSKKNHYRKIMGNETLIKVGKSKKTLNIMNISWGSPINNGLNLMKIHANAISKDDITQKFHFKLMEFTFL